MTIALSLANLEQPASASQWNAAMLTSANTVGLPTTTWQTGAIERSIFAVVANVQQLQDVSASLIAQAGFLDFSATGYVDSVELDGTAVRIYVTPDPSIAAQNPTGALGWLDVLADSRYDERRILSTFAGGALALLNTSASTYGPFVAGTYHVAQAGAPGVPGYSNTSALTIPPSAKVGGGTGLVTNALNDSGLISITLAAHGLSDGDVVFIVGVLGTLEANGAWAVVNTTTNTFDLVGSTFVNAYTSGGVAWVPTVGAFIADTAGSVATAATVNVVSTSVTSLIGVSVNNLVPWIGSDIEGNVALAARCRLKLAALAANGPSGAIEFYALSSQQRAPRLTPPLVVSSTITRALVTLDGTTGTIVLTLANGSGPPSATDVANTAAVVQANAILFGGTLFAQAAAQKSVAVAVTMFLPVAYNVPTTKSATQAAVSTYMQIVKIGGITDPGGAANVVPLAGVFNAIDVALNASGIPHQDMVVTLNGVAANVSLALSPVPEVAVLSPTPASVTLVSV